ncbi:Flavoprotein [Penicillium brevicompactum]|uniref:Flavoprotein n=1 Tax=Penicillium brevicompactum TaxID=5074 RepID=A0A9W9Q232_PENBR|nr:Flavoprotein [Penicillium brevicompactum]
MAVGSRTHTSTAAVSDNIPKKTWLSEMEVDDDHQETVIGNKGYRTSSDDSARDGTQSQHRRRRLLLSTDSAFADTVLPSLVQNPLIELRLITDEPSALLTGTNKIPHYMDTVDSQTFDKKTGARKWLKAKTAELCEWADMLLVAPIDAGALGAMLAGLTNTLTLALLRGWVSKKPVILIPGMTVSEWDHPLSTRQLGEIGRFWPWIRIVKPVLWKSNGPEELTILPWDGLSELHTTLETTLHLPPWQTSRATGAGPHTSATPNQATSSGLYAAPSSGGAHRPIHPKSDGSADFLPLEIWLSVFEDHLGDWETAKAVGIPVNLPVPQEWQSHLPKMSTPATLEYTILRGSFAAIKKRIDGLPRWKPLSDLACHLIVKFSRTDILSYLTENHLDLLWTTSRLTSIPYRASAIYGNPNVLTWWRDAPALPNKEYKADAMDGASRAGFTHVLDWWLHSDLPLRYSERALEAASAEGRVEVLEWWKRACANAPSQNPMPLKVGKSVLLAAQMGRTASLAWWDASGIPYSHAENVARIASTHGHVHVLEFWYRLKGPKMIFDNQVLVGPTKNGHDHVLQWWKTCGMRVEFKTCDIEEALEDADPSSGAEGRVRRWWERNGLNLGVGTSEWMRPKIL